MAQMVFAAQETSWSDVIQIYPELEDERSELEIKLGEKIEIVNISIFPEKKKFSEMRDQVVLPAESDGFGKIKIKESVIGLRENYGEMMKRLAKE